MITYSQIYEKDIEQLKDLCNALMAFQKSKATIEPERFDNMSFETRLVPSVKGARDNFFIVAKEEDKIIAYAYSNICKKEVYDSGMFGSFFDMNSVKTSFVGCLSQFYISENYRSMGIGSKLFDESIKWLKQFNDVEDLFIFVSNGNQKALEFYLSKGFKYSHDILNGFIMVLRN